MNQLIEVAIEVVIATLVLGLILSFVYNALFVNKDCSGTKPVGVGVILGVEKYSTGSSITTWTYNKEMDTNSICSWKCESGYQKSSSACTKIN
jgi:hypothetical protein